MKVALVTFRFIEIVYILSAARRHFNSCRKKRNAVSAFQRGYMGNEGDVLPFAAAIIAAGPAAAASAAETAAAKQQQKGQYVAHAADAIPAPVAVAAISAKSAAE